jgi:hypothetical protein
MNSKEKEIKYCPAHMKNKIKVDFNIGKSKTILIDTKKSDYLIDLLRKNPLNFENNVIQLFSRLCQFKKLHFFDIGANIGIYSLLCQKINLNAVIHAFEPYPANYHSFLKNIDSNKAFTIVANNCAIGKKNGTTKLWVPKGRQLSSVASTAKGFTALFHKKTEAINVPIGTLDEYVASHGLRVDLMKIDTEYSENEILLGARKSITHYRPVVLCEVLYHVVHKVKFAHPEIHLDRRHSHRIENFFKKLGYSIFSIGSNGILSVNTVHNHPDDRNFLFVPNQIKSSDRYISYDRPDFCKLLFDARNKKLP